MALNILVVPTIREEGFHEFLAAWKGIGDWDEMVLIEDNLTKTFDSGIAHHYSWAEIGEDLGGSKWVISRRDSAIRSYGFLVAYRLGADVVFTLDDDCLPMTESGFCEAHVSQMGSHARWVESIPGMRTRGLPYHNQGTMSNVAVNMGLWANIPDLDAVQTLSHGIPADFVPPAWPARIVPRGQYFPLCGMNISFRRELIPLFYFPLMGEGYPYRRFDDIWCGIIMKKICDHLGFDVSIGKPTVLHQRASDPFVNLVAEAPGIALNETFWQEIDAISLKSTSPLGCMKEVGRALGLNASPYLARVGEAISVWSRLFEAQTSASGARLTTSVRVARAKVSAPGRASFNGDSGRNCHNVGG